MHKAAITGTRIAIVVLFFAVVLAEIGAVIALLNGTIEFQELFTALKWPAIIGGVLLATCIEVALFCIWKLLPMTETDQIFDGSAFPWVDRLIGAFAAFTTITLVGGLILIPLGLLPQGLFVLWLVGLAVSAPVTMLLLVMKGLLVRASSLSQEMSEVI